MLEGVPLLGALPSSLYYFAPMAMAVTKAMLANSPDIARARSRSMGSIYWWSEGMLQLAIVLNGYERDGGRDDRTT